MDSLFLTMIGKRISEIRRSHKITQEKLADYLGVSPKHISHIECGTSSLSLKNLVEFCKYFNCSLDYIVFGNSRDTRIDNLPEEIVRIISSGNEKEINRLNRYLQVYVELVNDLEQK